MGVELKDAIAVPILEENRSGETFVTFNGHIEEVAGSIARHIEDWQNQHESPIPVRFAFEISRDFISLAIGSAHVAPAPTPDAGLVEALACMVEKRFRDRAGKSLVRRRQASEIAEAIREAALSKAGVA